MSSTVLIWEALPASQNCLPARIASAGCQPVHRLKSPTLVLSVCQSGVLVIELAALNERSGLKYPVRLDLMLATEPEIGRRGNGSLGDKVNPVISEWVKTPIKGCSKGYNLIPARGLHA